MPVSKGTASQPILFDTQFAALELELELAKWPAAHGFDDQRWTLARIKTVIRRRFHLVLHNARGLAAAAAARLDLAGPGAARSNATTPLIEPKWSVSAMSYR